jgi:ABC-type transport system involved in multi-copper enzyme maturation permease subunit
MTTALFNFVSQFLSLSWLTGPLFDKELRVSSRRKRNYVLRFVYVVLLTIFIAIVWLSVVKLGPASSQTAAFQKSRMAVAGKTIITTIVMFQFFATQLIAVIMLSTSISDEIYNRTLGLLMTTPINSFQIVMGKVFSKLFQLILLLAISLPLLAIVRVFGGVPWNYVISSLCITLTAVIFAGSLSLYFSVNNRRAYVVIIKTIFTLGVLFAFLPTLLGALFALLLHNIFSILQSPFLLSGILTFVFVHLNPFGAMVLNTTMMLSPAMPGAMPSFHWPVHCAIMLAFSALLLVRCVMIVRKVALRQATGQLELISKRRRRRKRKRSAIQTYESQHSAGFIRPVKGSPVVWKELRAPMIQGPGRRNSVIGLVVAIAALLLTYAIGMREKCLDEDFTHVSYTLLFVVIGSIFSMVLSAASITSEKESRAWPILLATSMDDWHILLGKAVGVFRKCLPIWLLLAGHVGLFILIGYIHPIAAVHLLMLVTGLVVFISGAGLYFSSLFRRTTSAVVATFALAIVLWVVLPSLLGLTTVITEDDDVLRTYVSANPVVQAVVVMYGAGGERNAQTQLSSLRYDWPYRSLRIGPTTTVLLVTMLIYIFAGLLFAWRAKCRFRRNIF